MSTSQGSMSAGRSQEAAKGPVGRKKWPMALVAGAALLVLTGVVGAALLVLTGVVGAALLVLTGVVGAAALQRETLVVVQPPGTREERVRGPADAPVVMVEYSDFQCTFCGQFAKRTEAEFIKKYVDTGLVRFEYKHFPMLGQESVWAANASDCAADEGRFWDYHDKLFSVQGKAPFSKENLKLLGTEIGITSDSFQACVDTGPYIGAARREFEEGKSKGVRATPTFFLNGTKLEGALPLSSFQAAVEKELAK